MWRERKGQGRFPGGSGVGTEGAVCLVEKSRPKSGASSLKMGWGASNSAVQARLTTRLVIP